MPRSNIRAKTIDVIGDDGSLIISIAQGEQLAFQVTCDWITDMENYTATFSVIEGDNVAGDLDEVPFDIRSGATAEDMTVSAQSGNSLTVTILKTLGAAWTVKPTPDDPAYGFFALQLEDNGAGAAQRVYVPIRGVIELRYNPVWEAA